MHALASTRVLVVEDEPLDALMVRRSLLRSGGEDGRFEVRHATTLSEALERLGSEPPDVMLLDLGLPDSEGSDTVARCRSRAPHLPLVVLTGSDEPTLAARTLAAGADGHLVKGEFGAPNLRGVLLQALERHGSREAEPRIAPLAPHAGTLADVRHLNALVLGNAQMLRDELADHPKLRARAEALVRAAHRAATVAEETLERGGPDEASTRAIDLSDLVRGTEPLVRALLPSHVRLRLALADELAPVRMCGDRLMAALLELVSNAVDAIGEADGSLVLATGAAGVEPPVQGHLTPAGFKGPHVWLEVRDDGAGFDTTSLTGATQPAFLPPGVDYGASPLARLVNDGAGLWVDSRPGAGATFRILIPS